MNEEALTSLRRAGAIAREARDLGAGMVAEGASLLDVAEEVEGRIRSMGAKPAFPCNISINEVAAHFTPRTGEKLKFANGDLVKIDVGAHVGGYIGDTAVTVEVGTKNWTSLIESSAKGLAVATEIIGEGIPLNTVGGAVDRAIRSNGHVPVTNLTGHSMKQYNLHAGLSVPNFDDGESIKVPNDIVLAIEPFATNGAGQVRNSKPGNIYRIMRERELRDQAAAEHFALLMENFGTLPFCERWATALDPKASTHLRMLVRHGLVFAYPVLSEVRGGRVSQKEHTVVIHDSRAEITT
jgi:methionyl aminopeptidase